MENTQPTLPEGCGPGYDNSTCDNNPSPQPTLPEGCGPGYDNSTCGSSTPSSQLSLHDQICNAYHNDAVKALAALLPLAHIISGGTTALIMGAAALYCGG